MMESSPRGMVLIAPDARQPDMSPEPPASSTYMSPAVDYPLRTGPAEPLERRDVLWLLGLLFVALIPRMLVAVRLGPVCDDGYFYLAVAEAYQRGDLHTALWYLNINIYPLLLAGFDWLGADPLAAAQAWGVGVATLTVLPLFGWLRRLLDRRVAFAACCLYAVHPEFIEVSPEPIRDATFWLLSATSLYFLWRAAAERRLWLFVAAGMSVAFAAHTRSEGWLLLLPAIAWPLVRWRESHRGRWMLAGGTAAAFAITPLFVVAFNLTILRDHDRWEWGKLQHFQLALQWAGAIETENSPPQTRPVEQSPLSVAGATAGTSEAAPVVPPTLADTVPELARQLEGRREQRRVDRSSFLHLAVRALEPVPLLLMLAGAIGWRQLLIRREHLVLSAICLAVFLGVWVRLSTLGEINGRYFLVCFFPASGAAGLGLLWVLATLERTWFAMRPRPRAAAAVTSVAVLIGGAHVADAVAGVHPSRDREAEIGRLLGERLGQDRVLVVLPHACRVGYYASGKLPVVVLDDTPIETLLDRHSAEVVILEHGYTPAEHCADLATRLIRRGWRPYELKGLPDADRFVVLTRPILELAQAGPLRTERPDVR